MELAKAAQQAYSSLGQNVDALRQKTRSHIESILDAERAVATAGLEGVDKWEAEVTNVNVLLQRARAMAQEGRTKEAESLYEKVISQAQSLATSAPDYLKQTGKEEALGLIQTAGKELMSLDVKGTTDARMVNERLATGIQQAGTLVQSLIQNQIQSHQNNIAALDRNTAALMGKIQAPSRPEAEKLGVETPTGTENQQRSWYGTPGTSSTPTAPSVTDNIAAVLSNLSEAISQKITAVMPQPPSVLAVPGAPGGVDLSVLRESGGQFQEGMGIFQNIINTAKDALGNIKISVDVKSGKSTVDLWG